jgi:hypothetical protein
MEYESYVFGERILGDKPTEIYVEIMARLLKRYPELIGQFESYFTVDMNKANTYTGTTRYVIINGRNVAIKTGFSTKAKGDNLKRIAKALGLPDEAIVFMGEEIANQNQSKAATKPQNKVRKDVQLSNSPEEKKFFKSLKLRYAKSPGKIQHIEIPDGFVKIPDKCFHGFGVTSIRIPASVKEIGEAAFERSGFEQIYLSNGLERIGDSAFSACVSLERLELPDSVKTIGVGAFNGCQSLVSIKLPNYLKEIPASAFGNCYALENIIIPASVEKIGNSAFRNCEHLKSIQISGNVEIARDAFFNTALRGMEEYKHM